PVLLPLQEVLKNLPTAALKIRDDQEETRAEGSFETPFSIKAKEDAKRFAGTGTPVAKTTGDQDKKTAAETAPKQTPPEIIGSTKGEEKPATVPKSSAKPVQFSFKQSATEAAPNE